MKKAIKSMRKSKNAKSLYFGVYPVKGRTASPNTKQWGCKISYAKKVYYIGTFETEMEAAESYNLFVIRKKMVRAPMNFSENAPKNTTMWRLAMKRVTTFITVQNHFDILRENLK